MATGDKKIEQCHTCGKKVMVKESLYAITTHEIVLLIKRKYQI